MQGFPFAWEALVTGKHHGTKRVPMNIWKGKKSTNDGHLKGSKMVRKVVQENLDNWVMVAKIIVITFGVFSRIFSLN